MLAGANTEDHPSWMQDAEGAKRLRDDAGVVAERRRVDRGPQGDAGRVLSDRREPREREWCVSIGMPPRLEVVADENRVETVVLGGDGEIEQLARAELLGRGLVAEPQMRLHERLL